MGNSGGPSGGNEGAARNIDGMGKAGGGKALLWDVLRMVLRALLPAGFHSFLDF